MPENARKPARVQPSLSRSYSKLREDFDLEIQAIQRAAEYAQQVRDGSSKQPRKEKF